MKRDGICSSRTHSESSSVANKPNTTQQSLVSVSAPPSMSQSTTINTVTSDVVHFTPSSTTSSLATDIATPSPCLGNQIERNCVGASFPSETPYSGIRGPVCQSTKSNSDTCLRVNSDNAKQAAADYCETLAQQSIVLDAQATAPKPYSVSNAAENAGQVVLCVIFDISGCPTDMSQTPLEFTKLGDTECQDNFYLSISEACKSFSLRILVSLLK